MSKFSTTLWMSGKVVQPVFGMLSAILVKMMEWCVFWVNYNMYRRPKPLVGWDKGQVNPSRILISCENAFIVCGHSRSRERCSNFMFSTSTTDISSHSSSVWSQGPAQKNFRGHFFKSWYIVDQLHFNSSSFFPQRGQISTTHIQRYFFRIPQSWPLRLRPCHCTPWR